LARISTEFHEIRYANLARPAGLFQVVFGKVLQVLSFGDIVGKKRVILRTMLYEIIL